MNSRPFSLTALRYAALAALALPGTTQAESTFTLQLLHASDLEGGIEAIHDAPNFTAVTEALQRDAAHQSIPSITVSAGDNYLPGPFYSASGDRTVREAIQTANEQLFGLAAGSLSNLRENPGRVDVTLMNLIGFDASALGNHEFDPGTDAIASLLATDIRGETLDRVRWLGTQFPYLSANLDFSADPALSGLVTDELLLSTAFQSLPSDLNAAGSAPKIAPFTIIERNGERIGLVGGTTPLLESISSPNPTIVKNPGAGNNNMIALASILQPAIDQVHQAGVNKIILTTHLQQIALEQTLAGLLHHVDIIVAGGSDTVLADTHDRLRTGDQAAGDYPLLTQNADGEPVAIVSTDGQYRYVGRLVLGFDAQGIIDPGSIDASISGAYATDDTGVAALFGDNDAFATGTRAASVQLLTSSVSQVVADKDSNTLGLSTVYLEGRRTAVRTEETNLGNLTADANLNQARRYDATVQVSLKNGGGIRAEIGRIDNANGDRLPPAANPASNKPEGGISQLAIENSLRFNNTLTLITLTAEQLKHVFEHAVAASGEGATPGQFPQVGGVRFSFDPSQAAIEFDETGQVTTAGQRIRSLALYDTNSDTLSEVLVSNGILQGDPQRPVRIVTLNFLADGGDNYPYPFFEDANPAFANRVELSELTAADNSNLLPDPGTEQGALGAYLLAQFASTPFNHADTAAKDDLRIQNLALRTDTILADTLNDNNGSDWVPPSDNPFELLLDPAVFDAVYYLQQNPEVQALVGDDATAAAEHWRQSGSFEGRVASTGFNLNYYLSLYPDVEQAFDSDPASIVAHWLKDGIYEGRIAASPVRFATFNAALNRDKASQLISDLSTPDTVQAQAVAEIIQRVRPDVLLLNEFDYDTEGTALAAFQTHYLAVSQQDAKPIEYPYHYLATSNTGLPSGVDLDNDGSSDGPGDAFGFGFFPGQFGMVVLSKYPIVTSQVRTFQQFLWKDMPDALLPVDPASGEPWYSAAALEVLRLSSKSHWDIPIEVGGETIHLLASHPTPPVFDGEEDRNGRRNHDEIRFWADYVEPERSAYIYDDQGQLGGLATNTRFVIVGDQNADPFDGDSTNNAIAQLLQHPQTDSVLIPTSLGGQDAANQQAELNLTHQGLPQYDTADFNDAGPGNLRVDYVLPSVDMLMTGSGVFWPKSSDPLFRLVADNVSSDHRLVWADVATTLQQPGIRERLLTHPQVFDTDYYHSQNPEVAALVGHDVLALTRHWLSTGFVSGLQANADFEVNAYLNNNPDVQFAYKGNRLKAVRHWLAYGIQEGRHGTE